MAPIKLPLEVIERIIDDVAEDDDLNNNFSSIKACALVCHSFLPRCRKHIFASVTLNSRRPPSPTSDDLKHLLSNSPHLVVYIRTLDYNVNKKEFALKRFSWLLPMFKKLVNLQKLGISYSPAALGRRLDWTSPSERKVLLPLLHLPTLTSIRLSTIRNFPLADLTSCVNVKTLQIECLECSTWNSVGKFLETLPATPVMLEQLVIIEGNIKPVQQLCHARRPDGKPIVDFSSLKKISASVPQLDSLRELLVMVRNLHKISLIIDHKGSPDPPDPTSSLTGLFTMLKPSLRTLVDIDIEIFIIECGLSDAPLAGLCHELEKMVGENVIETIKLLIWVHPDCDCTRWGELDDVLMGSPEGWPALREVSLSFLVIITSRDDSYITTYKVLRELPMIKLKESNRVQFDFEVTAH